jgi:hypothetical protein
MFRKDDNFRRCNEPFTSSKLLCDRTARVAYNQSVNRDITRPAADFSVYYKNHWPISFFLHFDPTRSDTELHLGD